MTPLPRLAAVLLLLLAAPAWVAAAAEVRDDAGRRIRFDGPFRRIISLYGAHTENLFALGRGETLVGVGRNEVFPPEATRLPAFSYHDGAEKFLAARPDLVLVRPMIDRGYGPLVRQLEANGITVVSLQPNTVEEMLGYWVTLGRLTGAVAEARAMGASFQEAVAAFRRLTDGRSPKVAAYFEAVHDRTKTFLPGSMPIFALEAAGGVNVASDARQVRTTNIADYGRERLLSRGEDIEVYFAQVGAMNQPDRETIRTAPGFELIRAVRTGRIYLVDETVVSRPTRRLLVGIWTLGTHLYPEAFCGRGVEILRGAGLEPPVVPAACRAAAEGPTGGTDG